jgi:hypothetical protein
MTSTDPHSHGRGAAAGMQNPEVGHDESDVDVATILRFGAGLAAIVVVCAVIVWLVFRVLDRQAASRDPKISPVAVPSGQLPPGPRLETNERAALSKFRAEEATDLDRYGWINQLGGVAHIPVAEAKNLLLKRGLPTRGGPADPLEGTHAPSMGEATGGRKIGTALPAGAPAPAAAPAAPEAGNGK